MSDDSFLMEKHNILAHIYYFSLISERQVAHTVQLLVLKSIWLLRPGMHIQSMSLIYTVRGRQHRYRKHNQTSKTWQIKTMRYTPSFTIFLICSTLSGAANWLYWRKEIYLLSSNFHSYLPSLQVALQVSWHIYQNTIK